MQHARDEELQTSVSGEESDSVLARLRHSFHTFAQVLLGFRHVAFAFSRDRSC